MKEIKTSILPLVISILLILISFGITLSSDYVFTTKHYVGIGCLLVSLILYFSSRRTYFVFFALTLTTGLLGFLDFYITSYKIGISIFTINPVFLGLMILFFYVSKKEIDELSPDKNETRKRVLDENLIQSFESKFKDKTKTELKKIIAEDSKFTNEAKAAAKTILEKKNVL